MKVAGFLQGNYLEYIATSDNSIVHNFLQWYKYIMYCCKLFLVNNVLPVYMIY